MKKGWDLSWMVPKSRTDSWMEAARREVPAQGRDKFQWFKQDGIAPISNMLKGWKASPGCLKLPHIEVPFLSPLPWARALHFLCVLTCMCFITYVVKILQSRNVLLFPSSGLLSWHCSSILIQVIFLREDFTKNSIFLFMAIPCHHQPIWPELDSELPFPFQHRSASPL